jgi:ribose transport system substrate-binding protein
MLKIQNILIVFLIIIFLIVFIFTLNYINKLEDEIDYSLTLENCFNYGDKYHFVFITPNIDDSNWVEIKNGALEAAKKYNLSIEFNGSKNYDEKEEEKFMDIAINSKVDGIIIYVTDVEKLTPLINQVDEKGIPVITMGKEAIESKVSSYIPYPNYKIGVEAAKELQKIDDKKLEVAVIVKGDKSEDIDKLLKKDVIYNGFKDTIKDYSNIEIEDIYITDGLLDTSKLTRDLINNENINTIFCTGIDETIVVVQTIVDLNSVDKITTIGLGDGSEILRLIENGIIKASIITDQYKIGYDSIVQLVNIKKDKHVSKLLDVDVIKINKDNIEEYILDKEGN